MITHNPPDVILLKVREVMARVGLSRPSIYARMAAGAFPKPIYPAPGRRAGAPMRSPNGSKG